MNKEDVLNAVEYIIREEKEFITKADLALKPLGEVIELMEEGDLKEKASEVITQLAISIMGLMRETNELIDLCGHISNLLEAKENE